MGAHVGEIGYMTDMGRGGGGHVNPATGKGG